MTLIPRVRIGAYGNGTVGLKTSTPGNDVTTLIDDNDSNKRSFNSQWTNLTKISQIGISTAPNTGTVIPLSPSLGYAPYFETRIWDPSTNTFYDDYCRVYGNLLKTTLRSTITATALTVSAPATSHYCVFVIFAKEASP